MTDTIVFSSPTAALAMDCERDDLVARMRSALAEDFSLDTVLGVLTSDGFSRMPDFACAAPAGALVRILARGGVSVDVETRTGAFEVAAAPGTTWREEMVEQPALLRLRADGRTLLEWFPAKPTAAADRPTPSPIPGPPPRPPGPMTSRPPNPAPSAPDEPTPVDATSEERQDGATATEGAEPEVDVAPPTASVEPSAPAVADVEAPATVSDVEDQDVQATPAFEATPETVEEQDDEETPETGEETPAAEEVPVDVEAITADRSQTVADVTRIVPIERPPARRSETDDLDRTRVEPIATEMAHRPQQDEPPVVRTSSTEPPAMITAIPTAVVVAPSPPSDDRDADAAPIEAAKNVATVPSQGADGEHDGLTVVAAALKDMVAEIDAQTGEHSTGGLRAVPTVEARHCVAGHPNPAEADTCRVCHATVTGAVTTIHRPSVARLAFSTGMTVEVDRPQIIGRRPSLPDTNPQRELPGLIAVPDPHQDLSRNHLAIDLEGWVVLVTDLGATNGTTVTHPGQQPVRLRPHVAVALLDGSRVAMGDVSSFVVEAPSW